MTYRRPNKAQKWYCSTCKNETVHTIPDLDSEWQYLDEIRVFRRWHRCKDCLGFVATFEMEASDVNRMCAALDQTRALEVDHKRLVAALEARSKAEAEINRFFGEDDLKPVDDENGRDVHA